MKVGLELDSEYAARRPPRKRFESLLEQTRLAREYGFDCVHVGQHFLSWPLQIIQPVPLLARLAAEAGDMYLGTGILLLPLFHPVDVAEQIATLDMICNGRFIFGVGLGYEEEEFRAFGIDKRHRASRFEESLEIIKRLWTEDRVTFQGRHFQLSDVVPTARPIQTPYPPIWIAANNYPAVRRAARLGDAWYANPHSPLSVLEDLMRAYRTALAELGKPLPDIRPVMRDGYVAETTRKAFVACRQYLEHRYQVYIDKEQDRQLPPGDRFDTDFEALGQDRFIIGDPDFCVEQVKRYERAGFNYIIFEFQWADMPDGLALECLHLLGREVLPRLR